MNQFVNNPYMMNFQQQSNVNWIDVNNINDINNISVQPNTTAWIRFVSEPIIAKKTSDSMGMCKTEYFKIEKIELNQQTNSEENFVTKADFERFMTELNSKIDTINKNSNRNK